MDDSGASSVAGGGALVLVDGGGVNDRSGPCGASVELRRELGGTTAAGKVELRVGIGRRLGNEAACEPSLAGTRGPEEGTISAESAECSEVRAPGTDSRKRRSAGRWLEPKLLAISAWLATRSRATIAMAVASSAQSVKR